MSPTILRDVAVACLSDDGPVTVLVPALHTVTPGLIIIEVRAGRGSVRGSYNLTHAPSGCRVGLETSDVFGLLRLARDLGEVCDWTRPARDVLADRDRANEVFAACDIEWKKRPEAPGIAAATAAHIGLESMPEAWR